MSMLWILCGVAVVAMTLVVLAGSGAGRTRSLDDVYARRAQRTDASGRPAADAWLTSASAPAPASDRPTAPSSAAATPAATPAPGAAAA